MKIAIVGTGYVGLVTGACFSEMGIDVTCVDVDNEKIEKLQEGIIPIYEPNLDLLVSRNVKAGRLHFEIDLSKVVNQVDILFCAVGTPPDEDGKADLKYVLNVAHAVGKYLNKYLLVVTKSTVPVGTAMRVEKAIQQELNSRKVDIEFDVASNPEFLKEGSAIEDFMKPDRVVIGTKTERARELMSFLYRPLMLNNFRVIFMDIPSAEMTKYAANSMLATRISFMNDIANLCELVGADVNMVRQGIGSDLRIGNKFLYPGCGYGGSCFPKDVKALIQTASDYQYKMRVLEAVEEVNGLQKRVLFRKLSSFYHGDLNGKKIVIWGLAFKPDTDDMREAPSLVIVDLLLTAGCEVAVYDPIALPEAKKRLGKRVSYAENMYDKLIGADALLLLTEWKEFRIPYWNIVKKSMNTPVILDGRNIYNRREMLENGFIYECIG